MKKRLTVVLLLSFIAVSMLPGRDKLALVLSGGGARGIAHVAVIEELDRRGIVPDMVIGTSMGALVGAFYAAGWSGEEIESLMMNADLMNLIIRIENVSSSIEMDACDAEFNILVTGFGREGLGTSNGILNDQAVSAFIRKNLSKVLDIDDFDKLSIPFRAIGTDIVNSSEIVFSAGSLFDAMRSSMSLPLVFSPVRLADGTYVMDGGMVNNLPADIARDMGADTVLAVDVNDSLHQYDSGALDYDTLSGAFNAFSSVITQINSVPKYDIADLVIVPDVDDFSTIQFDKAAEILDKGREAVAANYDFFDMLEGRYGGRARPLPYSERPAVSIRKIERSGIDGFDSAFDSFIGRSIDSDTIEELEGLLDEVRINDRLKKLGYRIENGIITLEPEYYKDMAGLIGLGATGDMGIMFDGYNSPFFFINPKLAAAVQYRLSPQSLFSFCMAYDDTLTVSTRYSTPVSKKGFFFTGIDFRFGNLTVLSMRNTSGHLAKNDIGLSIIAGMSYEKPSLLMLNAYIGLEYMHPSRLVNPSPSEGQSSILIDYQNIIYPYAAIDFTYDGIDWKKTVSDGIDIRASLSAGADIPIGPSYSDEASAIRAGYSASVSFLGEGGSAHIKSLTELSAAVKRRHSMLSSSYSVTKSGRPAHDYIYLSESVRFQIMESRFYADGGIFCEFSDKYRGASSSSYYSYFPSLIPFSMLSSWNAGIVIGAGYSSPIGHIFADIYLSAGDRFSMSFVVGIR